MARWVQRSSSSPFSIGFCPLTRTKAFRLSAAVRIVAQKVLLCHVDRSQTKFLYVTPTVVDKTACVLWTVEDGLSR